MSKKANIERFGRVSVDRDAMAKLFRERREALGLSIRQMADRAGVGATTIHNLEQGNSGINLETFLRVLAVLDLLPENVLMIDDEGAPPPATPLEAELAELLRREDYAGTLRLLALRLENKK